MSLTTLRCTTEGAVATIALARPEKLNALNGAMHRELREALAHFAQDDSIRVVVLTGEGRGFSSGQDLTEDLPRDTNGRIDLGPPLARDYNPLILQLMNHPKVTIAALNGPAVGASMNIALACDMVVAARSAYLQEAFAKIALIPDAGGTWILPRIVGPKLALALDAFGGADRGGRRQGHGAGVSTCSTTRPSATRSRHWRPGSRRARRSPIA